MPLPGDGPFDRLLRSVFFDDEADEEFGGSSRGDVLMPGWPHHEPHHRLVGMMSPQNSGYQVHKDDHEIQVDIDLPGVAAKDVKVEVWNHRQHPPSSCVVQWSGERAVRQRRGGGDNSNDIATSSSKMRFANRIRLGPSVDCDQLAANLSRGVLKLTAPLKQLQPEESQGPRSIPIATQDD